MPFLAWVIDQEPSFRERITVLSRGGSECWYAHLGVGYADLYDHLTHAELRGLQDAVEETHGGTRRQKTFTAVEEELFERLNASLGVGDAAHLHPSAMFAALRRMQKSGRLFASGAPFIHQPFLRPDPGPIADRLPDEFVAVRFYFNLGFPDTEANRRFAQQAVERLAERTSVVLLNPALRFDDHRDFDPGTSDRIVRLDDLMTPRNNLAVQTAAIAAAKAFIGTYGGLSYLPIYLDVPALAVYSDRSAFYQHHLDIANRVTRQSGLGRFTAIDVADLELSGLVLGTG